MVGPGGQVPLSMTSCMDSMGAGALSWARPPATWSVALSAGGPGHALGSAEHTHSPVSGVF